MTGISAETFWVQFFAASTEEEEEEVEGALLSLWIGSPASVFCSSFPQDVIFSNAVEFLCGFLVSSIAVSVCE